MDKGILIVRGIMLFMGALLVFPVIMIGSALFNVSDYGRSLDHRYEVVLLIDDKGGRATGFKPKTVNRADIILTAGHFCANSFNKKDSTGVIKFNNHGLTPYPENRIYGEGEIESLDKNSDLCIISITKSNRKLKYIRLAEHKPEVYDSTTAFGYAYGRYFNVTSGKYIYSTEELNNPLDLLFGLSAVTAFKVEFDVVTSQSIRGMSGGPVVNGSGDLVGVTAKTLMSTQLNWIVPVEYVKKYLRAEGYLGAKDSGRSPQSVEFQRFNNNELKTINKGTTHINDYVILYKDKNGKSKEVGPFASLKSAVRYIRKNEINFTYIIYRSGKIDHKFIGL